MTIKTNSLTRGLLAAMSFWIAALVIAILVAMVALHVVVGEIPFGRFLQP